MEPRGGREADVARRTGQHDRRLTRVSYWLACGGRFGQARGGGRPAKGSCLPGVDAKTGGGCIQRRVFFAFCTYNGSWLSPSSGGIGHAFAAALSKTGHID
jgi:hypothetical protein